MKIDLTQKIYDSLNRVAVQKYQKMIEIDGVEKETLETQEVTIGRLIADCVLYEMDGKKELPEKEHLLRYSIFEKVRENEEADFSSGEIKFIKGLLCKRCLPLWAGQALRVLNK